MFSIKENNESCTSYLFTSVVIGPTNKLERDFVVAMDPETDLLICRFEDSFVRVWTFVSSFFNSRNLSYNDDITTA